MRRTQVLELDEIGMEYILYWVKFILTIIYSVEVGNFKRNGKVATWREERITVDVHVAACIPDLHFSRKKKL